MNFTRRTFLKTAAMGGASIAAADGVTKKVDKLIPYVVPPEELSPVDWHYVATTCRECPAGCGMYVRHLDGRVIKAEGNPVHPVNRGGLCPRGQSALQGIYDPDRIGEVMFRAHGGAAAKSDWNTALADIGRRLRNSGGRVAVMSRLETGTLAEIVTAFLRAVGSDHLLYYEAFNYEPLRKANAALFGRKVIPYYHLDKCDYIISLAADFLETWVSNVQFAWQYAAMHELKDNRIGRFDYIGPRLSMTAANADRFVQVAPGEEKDIALGILKILTDEKIGKGVGGVAPLVENLDLAKVRRRISEQNLRMMARRFADGKSVALAGPSGVSGPEAEQLAVIAAAMNSAAGAMGEIVDFSRPHALSNTGTSEDVASFLRELSPDDILIIHKTNPVYSHPGSAESIRKAGLVVYLGTLLDETAELADWFLPVNDDLESWGDYEPWAGIDSLIQATMRPIADTRDSGDVLIGLAAAGGKVVKQNPDGSPVRTSYDWLRGRWEQRFPQEDWEDSLRRGGVWSGFEKAKPRTASMESAGAPVLPSSPAPAHDTAEASLWMWASVMLFDGRTANRGWIQEAPEPVSTIMWGSWIDIHPNKAKALGIEEADVIRLTSADGRYVEAPARLTQEVSAETAALCYGQGHTAMGRIAKGIGANAFGLMPVKAGSEAYFGRVKITKTGRNEKYMLGMHTKDQHDRDLHRWVDLEKAKTMELGPLKLPLPEAYTKSGDLYKGHVHNYHRWAMTIDLQRCIGCGACAVACYAENNLLVVGKGSMSNTFVAPGPHGLGGQRGIVKKIGEFGLRGTGEGRIMAWLRIVPYRHNDDPLRIGFLPMPCQHCDSAPCEPVCPVFAAVNNEEGVNAQIYNRCIGTRYCSNNCPYKVRRFNWLNTHWEPPLDMQLNPEVTVRCRGVMEKCTFCIQRIRHAEYQAKRENRKVRDGEVQPACVQSCPTRVYEFGDLLDPDSKVSKITRNDRRRYHVLEDLNTKPAVTYLFRILQEKK